MKGCSEEMDWEVFILHCFVMNTQHAHGSAKESDNTPPPPRPTRADSRAHRTFRNR